MCASPVQSGTATRLHCANGFSLSDKESKIPNLNACAYMRRRKKEKRKRNAEHDRTVVGVFSRIFVSNVD